MCFWKYSLIENDIARPHVNCVTLAKEIAYDFYNNCKLPESMKPWNYNMNRNNM